MASAPLDARAVANHFIRLAAKEGKQLTPMQLVKLAYIAHGCHLALLDRPLINERVQAWRWGPVVPSIYHLFKRFGGNPIPGPVESDTSDWGEERTIPVLGEDEDEARKLLSAVWKAYRDKSGPTLSFLTHRPGTPWYQVTSAYRMPDGELPQSLVIPDEEIQRYYKNFLGAGD